MKVRLFTRDGGYVADAEIPPFNEFPDVIIWGERFFVAPDVDRVPRPVLEFHAVEEQHAYVEAFTYAIVPPAVGWGDMREKSER
jgi:hypothetical protein